MRFEGSQQSDVADGGLQVLMLNRNRCCSMRSGGADTGNRLILVLTLRGSHHLAPLNLSGQRQHRQHLGFNVSCFKRKFGSFFKEDILLIKATPLRMQKSFPVDKNTDSLINLRHVQIAFEVQLRFIRLIFFYGATAICTVTHVMPFQKSERYILCFLVHLCQVFMRTSFLSNLCRAYHFIFSVIA